MENNQDVTLCRDYTLPTIVHKKCLICNCDFYVKRKEIWAGRGKYCSRKCSYIGNGIFISLNSQKNRIEKKCKVCDNFIYIKKSHEHIEGTYCSKECQSIDYREIFNGDKNPNFKHGMSKTKEYSKEHNHKRRKFVSRDGNTMTKFEILNILNKTNICYWCNNKIKSTKCLDHYIPLARGGSNSIDNIVVTCVSCNARKHKKDPLIFANENGKLL